MRRFLVPLAVAVAMTFCLLPAVTASASPPHEGGRDPLQNGLAGWVDRIWSYVGGQGPWLGTRQSAVSTETTNTGGLQPTTNPDPSSTTTTSGPGPDDGETYPALDPDG